MTKIFGARTVRAVGVLAGCVAAVGLAVGGASASKQKVKDPKQDASASFDYCDVVTATAGHKGRRAILHSVKLASPNGSPSAAMTLYINLKGRPKQGDGLGNSYGAEYVASSWGIRKVKSGKQTTRGVRASSNKAGTKFKLKISTKRFGSPKKYGWMAFGPACGDGTDSAPGKGPVFSTAFVPKFKNHKTKP